MKRHGYVTVCDPGSDKMLDEADTIQCCHCGGHFVVRPGSGTERGFCTRCNGFVCGRQCVECVPTELYLSILEGKATGKEVSVPVIWQPGM